MFLTFQRQLFRELERWLHDCDRVVHLELPVVANMVVEAIEHRQQRGIWQMHEYVIMPNHLHLFFETVDDMIKERIESFKRWTANHANKLLGRTGRFWQIEWFDHWSRSREQDEGIVRYIRDNPRKAGLIQANEQWPYVGHFRRK